MKLRAAVERVAVSVTALAVCLVLGAAAARAAEDAKAPPPPAEAVKALLDEDLADWDDPGARQAVLRMVLDVFPARLAELEETVARNRDEAREVVAHLIEQGNRLVDLQRDEPREYERVLRQCRLEDETLALARKARAAQGQARDQLVAELKKKLTEEFDTRQEAMKRDLANMETEVENLRRRVAKRAENRDQLIDRRALDLLSDRDAEW